MTVNYEAMDMANIQQFTTNIDEDDEEPGRKKRKKQKKKKKRKLRRFKVIYILGTLKYPLIVPL